jgi:hypothetical protein
VTGWIDWGDWNYDYGAIILPSDLGNTTGWFGFDVWSDSDLLSSIGNLSSGYPGDKPPEHNGMTIIKLQMLIVVKFTMTLIPTGDRAAVRYIELLMEIAMA